MNPPFFWMNELFIFLVALFGTKKALSGEERAEILIKKIVLEAIKHFKNDFWISFLIIERFQ